MKMKSKNSYELTANDMNRIAAESRHQADFEEYAEIKERILYMAQRGRNNIYLEQKISDYVKTLLDQDGFVISIDRIPNAFYEGRPAYFTTIEW